MTTHPRHTSRPVTCRWTWAASAMRWRRWPRPRAACAMCSPGPRSGGARCGCPTGAPLLRCPFQRGVGARGSVWGGVLCSAVAVGRLPRSHPPSQGSHGQARGAAAETRPALPCDCPTYLTPYLTGLGPHTKWCACATQARGAAPEGSHPPVLWWGHRRRQRQRGRAAAGRVCACGCGKLAHGGHQGCSADNTL